MIPCLEKMIRPLSLKFFTIRFWTLCLILFPIPVQAQIQIHNPSLRTVPSENAFGTVFVTLINIGSKDRILLNARSEAADVTELHDQFKEDGLIKMRRLDRVVIPADSSIKLESGGMHIMLFGPKKKLKANDKVKITLDFYDNEEVIFYAIVKPIHTKHSTHEH